jgi:3-methyl-2-oxobutanoate hydroxymethyltransferase
MRTTISDIKLLKVNKEKVVMITAYDYTTARLVDESGIPLILVGDSLGNTMLGYESTIPVTMDEMIHHTKAVVRGTKKSLIVGDMPFMTYHTNTTDALRNAARFIQEGGAQAIKLEGGTIVADTVKHIVNCGIPVMGHIGLTPQFIHQLGGFKAQGKTPEAAKKLLDDARALEQAGAFAVVLEVVPSQVSRIISEAITIPTIGIGAGPDCDGQVQVIHDLLGLSTDFVPRHARQFAKLADAMRIAFQSYSNAVKAGTFPAKENSSSVDDATFAEIIKSCAV